MKKIDSVIDLLWPSSKGEGVAWSVGPRIATVSVCMLYAHCNFKACPHSYNTGFVSTSLEVSILFSTTEILYEHLNNYYQVVVPSDI